MCRAHQAEGQPGTALLPSHPRWARGALKTWWKGGKNSVLELCLLQSLIPEVGEQSFVLEVSVCCQTPTFLEQKLAGNQFLCFPPANPGGEQRH